MSLLFLERASIERVARAVPDYVRNKVQIVRDFNEWREAKKRREGANFRMRWGVKGAACASYAPRSWRDFDRFRRELERNRDFARASERLNALERAYEKRYGSALPVPEEVIQNADRSLSWAYGKLLVRAFPDGVAYLLGGTEAVGVKGALVRGVDRPLLEALRLKAMLQRAA